MLPRTRLANGKRCKDLCSDCFALRVILYDINRSKLVRSRSILTLTQFYTPSQWIWNKEIKMRFEVQTFSFSSRCFTKVWYLPFRNHSHLIHNSCTFREVFGKLFYKQFHRWMWWDPLLLKKIKQVKSLKLISGVKLLFGSCLTGTIDINYEDIPMQVKKAIVQLTKQNKSVREIEKNVGVSKSAV